MRILLFMGTIFSLLLATPAIALDEEDESENDGNIVEEVIVQGIKTSLRQAVEIKRSNVGVMEAITAEDFGKFPDGNLAESMARVPGIAIDRSNVEGQEIAVRGFGPQFNLVTLNGRQMPTAPGVWSGGRSFNFGDIASPGVSAVEVYKAADSTMPTGGIGATVNMVTTKPLNVKGTKRHFSLSLVEDSTSTKSDLPFESTVLFATNQGNWGLAFSGAYQERSNREEGTWESNWLTTEIDGPDRVNASDPRYTNNNTRADGYTFYQEPTAYQIKDNDRVRKNAQLTFQFAFTDDIITTLDYTYSNVDFEAEGTRFGSWLGGWDTTSALINERGVFTDVSATNRSYDHWIIFGKTENTNKSLGFNTEWQVNDALSLSLDAHQSTAEVDGGEIDSEINFTTDVKGTVIHTNGGPSGVPSFSYDTEFGPENYLASGATIRDGFKENKMEQVQLKGEWANLDEGLISSVEFGVSHIDSKFKKIRNWASFGADIGNSAAAYDDSLFRRTNLGNFMNAFDPDLGVDYYYRIDPSDALAAFIANNPGAVDLSDGTVCCTGGDIDSNDRVNEEITSAYVQLNMETDISGMPLNIVAGLRYEKSETESISLYAPVSLLRWDMIGGLIGVQDPGGPIDAPEYGKNEILLPSIAMSLGLDDNQVIRLSASRSMARPDLFDLSSEIQIGNQDFFQVTANSGDPDLNPLLSTNLDISYENYYAEGSYFAVNFFYKKIKDFIGRRTVSGQTIAGLTDPTQSAIGQFAIQCVNEWVDAGRPAPGVAGDPGATGDCVSQQALWAQPWMNDFQHMGWVALAMAAGADVSNGYPWSDGAADNSLCAYDGWWRCDPGYIDGTASDPLALIDFNAPYNMNSGKVNGFEFSLQHLFEGTPFGVQFNYTYISGGDVKSSNKVVGEQFILPGLGDSGNFSVFYEDDRHTVRLALNHRGETEMGAANYEQPLFVEERNQVDASYQFRFRPSTTFFLEASNITDEPTRLFVRHREMLFLSQDHGPIYKFGFRTNF